MNWNFCLLACATLSLLLGTSTASLYANGTSNAKSSEVAMPIVFDDSFYTTTLYEYIKSLPHTEPLSTFPFELIATRGGGDSLSPLAKETYARYYDEPRYLTWRVRLECNFEKYLLFYRIKEKTALATADEIEECVRELDKCPPTEKALVIISVFIFERIHRPYFGPEEMVKKDKTFWEKERPLYFVEMLPDYVPDLSISEEQWTRWNATIENFVGDPAIAFFPSNERFIDNDDRLWGRNNDKNDEAGNALIQNWISNIESCLKYLKHLTGENVSIEEFTAPDPLKRFESCRFLLSSIDKKIEELQGEERDLALALRDYWFSFSDGLSYVGALNERACIGNRSKMLLSLDLIARQLLYSRLEYQKELVEGGRIWHESDQAPSNSELKFDSDSLPIVFNDDLDERSLYEYIINEAPNMAIFPFELIATRPQKFENDAPFYEALYSFYGGPSRIWRERYESTFELYLPFYRFKVKVSRSTSDDIDECVRKIDECAPKEQALILTSIFIFERLKRPYYGPEEVVSKTISFQRDVAPGVYELLPEYAPDPNITDEQWNRWVNVISCFSESNKIAFPAFRPEQRYFYSVSFRGDFEIGPELLKKWELLADWTANLDRCLIWLQKLVGETPNRAEFAGDDCIAHHESCRKLLLALDKVVQESEGNKRDLALALRDYWLSLDQARQIPTNSGGSAGTFACGGNSSVMPKKLGVIARQLLYSRLEYDKALIEQNVEWYEQAWHDKGIRKPAARNYTREHIMIH